MDNFVLLLDRIIDRKNRVLINKNWLEDETSIFRKTVSDILEEKYDCTNSLLRLYQKGFQIYHDYLRVDLEDSFEIEWDLYVKIFSASIWECYKNKSWNCLVNGFNQKIIKKIHFINKKIWVSNFSKYESLDWSILINIDWEKIY